MQNAPAATASGAQAKRAYGRSLADFRLDDRDTPNGVLPAEEKLLAAAARGKRCDFGLAVPQECTDENRLRSEFLCFLLLGGDEQAPVHDKGIDLAGAFIEGDIDLESTKVERPFSLWNCRIEGQLVGRNARFGLINLAGSHIRGIDCDGAIISGQVFLREGFTSSGEVRFIASEIRGNLDCSGGTFTNRGGSALSCDNARIGGVFLCSNSSLKNGLRFSAQGSVRFPAAIISGTIECSGGLIDNEGGDIALNCDNIRNHRQRVFSRWI